MSNDRKKGDYEVGYGKPPRHTQFPPGVSGFKGRRKKRLELRAEIVARVYDEVVTVNGRPVTKFELAIQQTVNQTIKSGKPRDLMLMMELAEKYGAQPEAERYAEMKAGAEKVMKKIDLIVQRTLNIDPELARLRQTEDDEEAMLIMSCPHCSAALRQSWRREQYQELVKRNGKSQFHRQVEDALHRRQAHQ